MKKIAILNFKGGTGKTTTAVHPSYALVLGGQSVSAVNCDSQAGVADWPGVNPKNTFFDLLRDRVELENYIQEDWRR